MNTKAQSKDVFFRSHVVKVDEKEPLASTYAEPKWPELVLVFDTETTLDPKEQALLFAFYRVCRITCRGYECVEEGIVHADDTSDAERRIINAYVEQFDSEVCGPDYDEDIHVYGRAEFVERVFFEAIRSKSMVVTFNAPWDLSRLSVRYRVYGTA